MGADGDVAAAPLIQNERSSVTEALPMKSLVTRLLSLEQYRDRGNHVEHPWHKLRHGSLDEIFIRLKLLINPGRLQTFPLMFSELWA